MKIFYDHQVFSFQKYGGVSRYFYELMKNRNPKVNLVQNTIFSNNHYIDEDHIIPHKNLFKNRDFKGKNTILSELNKIKSIKVLKEGNFDIFHPTYYDPYFLKYLKGKPYVLTVYDMIHEKYSKLFPPNDKTAENKKILLLNADKIIAISESTKRDIVELIGVDAKKIDVVYLGASLYPKESKTPLKISEKYILFVGERGKYKNFDLFFQSYLKVKERFPMYHLVCTGKQASNKEIDLFTKEGVQDFVHFFAANDNELASLYQGAEMFVFPSLYEGFGIPILESFACSCPIALSNKSSFPEVAENAGVYFDPNSIESMYNAMISIIESPIFRSELIAKGNARLQKFSWANMAEETYQIYKK